MLFPVQNTPPLIIFFQEMWSVKKVLDKKTSCQNQIIAFMVTEMKTKFEKYWKISYSNYILVILDSRFKFGFVEFRLNKTFGDIAAGLCIV